MSASHFILRQADRLLATPIGPSRSAASDPIRSFSAPFAEPASSRYVGDGGRYRSAPRAAFAGMPDSHGPIAGSAPAISQHQVWRHRANQSAIKVHSSHMVICKHQDGTTFRATFASIARAYDLVSGAERILPEEHNAMSKALQHKAVQLDLDQGVHNAETWRLVHALAEHPGPTNERLLLRHLGLEVV